MYEREVGDRSQCNNVYTRTVGSTRTACGVRFMAAYVRAHAIGPQHACTQQRNDHSSTAHEAPWKPRLRAQKQLQHVRGTRMHKHHSQAHSTGGVCSHACNATAAAVLTTPPAAHVMQQDTTSGCYMSPAAAIAARTRSTATPASVDPLQCNSIKWRAPRHPQGNASVPGPRRCLLLQLVQLHRPCDPINTSSEPSPADR